VLLKNRPVEDILPSFTLSFAGSAQESASRAAEQQQQYLQVIVAVRSSAFDRKLLWFLNTVGIPGPYLSPAKDAAVV